MKKVYLGVVFLIIALPFVSFIMKKEQHDPISPPIVTDKNPESTVRVKKQEC
jgi:uncharacterized protein YxeA